MDQGGMEGTSADRNDHQQQREPLVRVERRVKDSLEDPSDARDHSEETVDQHLAECRRSRAVEDAGPIPEITFRLQQLKQSAAVRKGRIQARTAVWVQAYI